MALKSTNINFFSINGNSRGSRRDTLSHYDLQQEEPRTRESRPSREHDSSQIKNLTVEPKEVPKKKIYTFNVISNQPNLKVIPAQARMPYKYAIPFNGEGHSKGKEEMNQRHHNDNGSGNEGMNGTRYVFGIPLKKTFNPSEK